MSHPIRQAPGLRGSESGKNTASETRTGYDTSPLQYGQGTDTTQYGGDSSRFGEEDTEGGVRQQTQQGRGQGGIGTVPLPVLHIRNF